jgi:hypothetical protein
MVESEAQSKSCCTFLATLEQTLARLPDIQHHLVSRAVCDAIGVIQYPRAESVQGLDIRHSDCAAL